MRVHVGRMLVPVWTIGAAAAMGCGGPSDRNTEDQQMTGATESSVTYVDSGDPCVLLGVGERHDKLTYPAHTPVQLRVVPPRNEMLEWCIKSVSGECLASWQRSDVQLTSELLVEYSRGGDGAVCGPIDPYVHGVSCIVPPLPEGESRLVQGHGRVSFAVGGEGGMRRDDIYYSNPLFHCLRWKSALGPSD